jgi:hypothetical protein
MSIISSSFSSSAASTPPAPSALASLPPALPPRPPTLGARCPWPGPRCHPGHPRLLMILERRRRLQHQKQREGGRAEVAASSDVVATYEVTVPRSGWGLAAPEFRKRSMDAGHRGVNRDIGGIR